MKVLGSDPEIGIERHERFKAACEALTAKLANYEKGSANDQAEEADHG